ncbi:TIGR03899 family protein [Vibrio sp. SM6]|uniref:TIGR03899 family protein n=1 Tax=Vibrio agarilyticus TaxID=2726741 RepID=A0A7X8YFZ5_9VIBR|nr:TIGR03899 family protein [Vibrio agarilyticus]NLS12428.1 TIGR03899 family protein [Vibrio agarilyticus]
MAENTSSVVIEPGVRKTSNHTDKQAYVKDSAQRIQMLAETHGIAARLQSSTPEHSPLERALAREQKRKAQRQINLESIIKQAHTSCRDETGAEPERDWLERYFDMAQEIHNPMMQKLWAQVLRREVTNPGATSMKALRILKEMTPKEAQTLQRAAALGCSFGGDGSRKLLMGYKATAGLWHFGKREQLSSLSLASFQLPYASILVLMDLGLLHSGELESGEIDPLAPLRLDYQGKSLTLNVNTRGLRLIYYRFTPTGNELCKLLGNKLNNDYYDQLLALLAQKFLVKHDNDSAVHYSV